MPLKLILCHQGGASIKYHSHLTFQQRIRNWLSGRYGQNDQLNKVLMGIELLLVLVNLWRPTIIWLSLLIVCVVFLTWRLYSRKIALQIRINQHFVEMLQVVRQPWRHWFYQLNQHRKYRFFNCPNCEQRIRVPKHHGEIRITCPVCHHQFIEKT